MLSTPSSSALRHASRSSVMVHCCGWIVTPTLKRRPPCVVGGWSSAMVQNVVPVEVNPNSADADFWRRYHAFRRERHAETRPDDPARPDELGEQHMKHERPIDQSDRHDLTHVDLMLRRVTAAH